MAFWDWLSNNWYDVISGIVLVGTLIFAICKNKQRKKETENLKKIREEDFGQTYEISKIIVWSKHKNLVLDLSNKNHLKPLDIAKMTLSGSGDPQEIGLHTPTDGYFLSGAVKTVETTPLFKRYNEFLTEGATLTLTIIDGYGVHTSVDFQFREGVCFEKYKT
ncbi:MAG: hypothetical protein JW885_12045 [Deltaproteobacteria bacterium]|nr:hypothetical protein [Candidatus Zymogenaceae bacterium]